ncbi:MAG: NAD(+) synthase [Muribaculaceae bacterium]|nr:NAD(+) synthase [Muribaculaceae bacterium]
MELSFLRVAAIVPQVNVADCELNVKNIVACAHKACESGAKVLLYPELCVTAYTCGDLFSQSVVQRKAVGSLCEIKNATSALDCVLVVGAPLKVGVALYDCAVVMSKGEFIGVVPRTYITANDKKWFVSGTNNVNGLVKIGEDEVAFGTDLLFVQDDVKIGIEIGSDMMAPVAPSVNAALNGANVILNLSATNEELGMQKSIRDKVKALSSQYAAGYVYASCGYGESTTDLVYGGKAIIAENGKVIAENTPFSGGDDIVIADIDVELIDVERSNNSVFVDFASEYGQRYAEVAIEGLELKNENSDGIKRYVEKSPYLPKDEDKNELCAEAVEIQVMGLMRRLQFTGIKSVVIGVSGGLDSTLALLVCHKAFTRLGYDYKDIVGITMPGFGTSGRTYNNALNLMSELGISQKEISIKDSVLQHFEDIGHDVNEKDVTYENSQARERTQILMDYSNRCNGLVLGTGDLSELALGWATYNGDHMSMYGVNAGIPKTLVQELVRWFAYNSGNEKVESILLDIVDTPISPELTPADEQGNIKQKTEDLVGPYELHDFFIFNVMKYGFSPKKVYGLAKVAFAGEYDDETIKKWLRTFYRRFFTQQFKRSCLPDGPKVVSVSLSPRGSWVMPSDASVKMWLAECDSL